MPEYRVLGKHPDGKEMRGFEIDFEPGKERWSDYTLSDGSRVRVKQTLTKIFRLVDENDEPLFDENGDPQVLVNGTIIVVTSKGESTGGR